MADVKIGTVILTKGLHHSFTNFKRYETYGAWMIIGIISRGQIRRHGRSRLRHGNWKVKLVKLFPNPASSFIIFDPDPKVITPRGPVQLLGLDDHDFAIQVEDSMFGWAIITENNINDVVRLWLLYTVIENPRDGHEFTRLLDGMLPPFDSKVDTRALTWAAITYYDALCAPPDRVASILHKCIINDFFCANGRALCIQSNYGRPGRRGESLQAREGRTVHKHLRCSLATVRFNGVQRMGSISEPFSRGRERRGA